MPLLCHFFFAEMGKESSPTPSAHCDYLVNIGSARQCCQRATRFIPPLILGYYQQRPKAPKKSTDYAQGGEPSGPSPLHASELHLHQWRLRMKRTIRGPTGVGTAKGDRLVGGYLCQQQKDWGKCSEDWMHPVCDSVCGG